MNGENPNKEPDYDFLIEIVEDVDAFIGDDLRTYGPYSSGDIVNVPKYAAKTFDILLKNGFAWTYDEPPERVWLNPLFERAVKYFYLGLNIVPLREKGKVSIVPWKKYQIEKIEIRDVDRWWSQWPNANIGIVTGSISRLLVLDIDGEEGRQSLKIASNDAPINTPVARSSRGKHYYFRANRIFRTCAGILPGVDVRCEGGLIVAPPSVHPSGRVYEWEKSIFDFSLEDTPEWLCEILIENESKDKTKDNAKSSVIPVGRR
ncbi:MAG TPA: bifunctional DNA primase/polymerase, partial [Candidatus Pacearchaeota archaeon]|nr:bifunctional DNA primase/polymerase [Candidatus Pacearchaeota archaeon]